MSRGLPSMTALLGLLAIAGYQNRDKIAEMLGGLGGGAGGPAGQPGPQGRVGSQGGAQGGFGGPGGMGQAGAGGMPGGLGGLLGGLGGASAGGFLSGGLRDLFESFQRSGHGEVAESWVGRGPNKEIAPNQLEQAIGADVLDELSQRTGLSRQELVARLSRELPQAVDRYTPDGRLPTEADFGRG